MADLIGGQDQATIDRWLLDASQYKVEIHACAQLIKKAQREEADLATVRKALEAQTAQLATATNKLDGALKTVNDSLGKVGLGSAALAGGLAGLAASVIPQLVGKLGDIVHAQIAAVQAGDDWNDSVGRHEQAVNTMTVSAQHTIDKMQALTVARKLEAAGIQVSAEQYEGIGRAISRMTVITGDSQVAAERVSDSIVNVQARALKALGIEVKTTGDLEERRNDILVKMQGVQAARLDQMEREKALQKELKDAQLDLNAAMAKAPALAELLTFSQETRIQNEIEWTKRVTAGWKATAGGIKEAVDWAQRFAGIPVGLNWDKINAAGPAPIAKLEPKEKRPLVEKAPKAARGGSASGAFAGWSKIDREQAAWLVESSSEIEAQTAAMFKQEQARRRELELDAEAVAWKQRLADASAKAAAEDKRYWESVRHGIEDQKRLNAIISEATETTKSYAVNGLAQMAGGMWAAADAAIQGGQSFDVAMVQMVKSTLLGVAQQSTVKAVFETAEAFAALARWDIPSATNHFTSAGIFAAVAAGTGSVGLGISAASSGGGGAAASSGGGYSGGRGYSPSAAPRDEKQEPPKFKVVVLAGGANSALLAAIAKDQLKITVEQD